MNLQIDNEFGRLLSAVVCLGKHAPSYKSYSQTETDKQFKDHHPYPWINTLIPRQQISFLNELECHGVNLIYIDHKEEYPHQMFTRDPGFAIGDKFFYSEQGLFGTRNGEISMILESLNLSDSQVIKLNGHIEGGDVLVLGNNEVIVGRSSRTDIRAIEELEKNGVNVNVFELGQNVMHIDTRLTLLPKNLALIDSSNFSYRDRVVLSKKFDLIPVRNDEILGTNVFCINPETVVVAEEHQRIAKELLFQGFNVVILDYSELIRFGGSFRCTILPLEREKI